MSTVNNNDLVFKAIRLAEYAHRNRAQGSHYRKTPEGEDRPYYFVHLAEVAWILSDAGCSHELVAAGYLHDVIEDCNYTADQLEEKIGNRYVRELVEWVSEPDKVIATGKEISWEIRNQNYLERIKKAPVDALNISCADNTPNIREMSSWIEKGYSVENFTSRDITKQLGKFDALRPVFESIVWKDIYDRFADSLEEMRKFKQIY